MNNKAFEDCIMMEPLDVRLRYNKGVRKHQVQKSHKSHPRESIVYRYNAFYEKMKQSVRNQIRTLSIQLILWLIWSPNLLTQLRYQPEWEPANFKAWSLSLFIFSITSMRLKELCDVSFAVSLCWRLDSACSYA